MTNNKSSGFAHFILAEDVMEIHDRLKQARLRAGYERAKHAAESIGVGYYTYAQHENGTRGIPRDAILKYARRFRVSPDWLMTGRDGKVSPVIPLKRYIGAGGTVYPFDDDHSEFIDAPPGVEGDAMAAVVQGDSMYPRYDSGNVLIWTRQMPPMEMLNRDAVVGLADGRIMVKILTRGSIDGLFTLTSFNAAPIIDQVVEWAAPIEWVKK